MYPCDVDLFTHCATVTERDIRTTHVGDIKTHWLLCDNIKEKVE